MPARIERDGGGETAKTLDELAAALGMERTRLYRLRQDFGGAPDMHADGAFRVEEWREWLADIAGGDAGDDEEARAAKLERAKAQARREAALAAREELRLKKEKREVVSLEEHLAALKIPIAAAHGALDECEGQLLLVLSDEAARERVRAVFGAARDGFRGLLEAEIRKAAEANAS